MNETVFSRESEYDHERYHEIWSQIKYSNLGSLLYNTEELTIS
jgi:hypothetical protein